MKKYLYVEFLDAWDAYASAQICDRGEAVKSRIVKIALSAPQSVLLEPKKVGKNQGKDIFESMRLICIQEEED